MMEQIHGQPDLWRHADRVYGPSSLHDSATLFRFIMPGDLKKAERLPDAFAINHISAVWHGPDADVFRGSAKVSVIVAGFEVIFRGPVFLLERGAPWREDLMQDPKGWHGFKLQKPREGSGCLCEVHFDRPAEFDVEVSVAVIGLEPDRG